MARHILSFVARSMLLSIDVATHTAVIEIDKGTGMARVDVDDVFSPPIRDETSSAAGVAKTPEKQ